MKIGKTHSAGEWWGVACWIRPLAAYPAHGLPQALGLRNFALVASLWGAHLPYIPFLLFAAPVCLL